MTNIVLSVTARIQNFMAVLKEERGQDLMEYAILGGAIAVVAAIALFAITPGAFALMTSTIQKCVTFQNTCKTP